MMNPKLSDMLLAIIAIAAFCYLAATLMGLP
jgi:hypothetical protein